MFQLERDEEFENWRSHHCDLQLSKAWLRRLFRNGSRNTELNIAFKALRGGRRPTEYSYRSGVSSRLEGAKKIQVNVLR